MKHKPIIPEQHWLHEPDINELRRRLARRERLALYGWACAIGFAIAFFYAIS